MIVQEQTPGRVMEVRAKLYELLSHCIPATVILKVSLARFRDFKLVLMILQTIAERVVERVDETIKPDIMHWAAFYVSSPVNESKLLSNIKSQEVRMRLGSKKIFHLEAWVIKVMSVYKVGLFLL